MVQAFALLFQPVLDVVRGEGSLRPGEDLKDLPSGSGYFIAPGLQSVDGVLNHGRYYTKTQF